MKRVLNIAKLVIVTFVGIISVTMAGIYAFNKVSLHIEAGKIKDYGEKIDVFDGTINVVDVGEGKETIVLLPGFNTASPFLGFTPLIEELKKGLPGCSD